MSKLTAKEMGSRAWQMGLDPSANPFPKDTVSHTQWAMSYEEEEECTFSEPSFFFDEQKGIRNVHFYVYKAMERLKISSERELSKRLGKAPNFIHMVQDERIKPSDETMVALAELAGEPKEQALLCLNIWRAKDTTAASIYEKMATALRGVVLSAAFVVVTSAAPATGADFSQNAPVIRSSLYIMAIIRRVIGGIRSACSAFLNHNQLIGPHGNAIFCRSA